jgi:hypothetical protein
MWCVSTHTWIPHLLQDLKIQCNCKSNLTSVVSKLANRHHNAMAYDRPRWQATRNNKSVLQMMMAAMKRARVARAMVTAMRVTGVKEGKGSTDHGIGN